MPSVTIVVPLYGGVDELEQCLVALRATSLSPTDRVLLINDMGPESAEIERIAKRFAIQDDRWSYVRNARNVGFVATCNRAMVELTERDHDIVLLNSDAVPTGNWLDELTSALSMSPRAGAVSPRSNKAGLSTFPPRTRAPGHAPSSQSFSLWASVNSTLPRWTVAPTISGFCVLLRREALDAVGVFDPAFSPGYGEENDLAQRMRGAGYSCILANHAFVHHAGSASFTPERRNALAESHEEILRKRHPTYWSDVVEFSLVGRDPADHFAGLAEECDQRAVIVFCDRADGRTRDVWRSAAIHVGVSITLCPRTGTGGGRDLSTISRGLEHRAVWDAAIVVGPDSDADVRLAWTAPAAAHAEVGLDVESAVEALDRALAVDTTMESSITERAREAVHRNPLAWVAKPSLVGRLAKRLRSITSR